MKPKFQEVEEGREVIIDSEIVGDPLPKITWLRDGLKVRLFVFNSSVCRFIVLVVVIITVYNGISQNLNAKRNKEKKIIEKE